MRLDLRVSEIDLIESATQSIYEKKSGEWKNGLPVLWVNIEVKKEVSSADFKMIAYFYDANDKIIHKMNSGYIEPDIDKLSNILESIENI